MRVQSALLVLVCAAGVTACGGGGDEGGSGKAPEVAAPADFPSPSGRTLTELHESVGQAGPVLAPSVLLLEPGRNRYGFALFDRSRAQIAEAPAVLYVAESGGGPVQGPYPARYETLDVKAQFRSEGVEQDPDSAKSVYHAQLPLRRPGNYEVMAVTRLDDRLVASDPVGAKVVKDGPVPEVGEKAIPISTPTKESVAGQVEKIDTRVPPSTQHESDFKDVLGKKPVVLLFATPALCQSRVCGPVVDIAEQVKAEHGDRAEFIHMEIYRENELEKGFRPQVLAWKLPTEPWVFVIDDSGRVAERFEGAFSARELEHAVRGVTQG